MADLLEYMEEHYGTAMRMILNDKKVREFSPHGLLLCDSFAAVQGYELVAHALFHQFKGRNARAVTAVKLDAESMLCDTIFSSAVIFYKCDDLHQWLPQLWLPQE